jgi:hypothetical protein
MLENNQFNIKPGVYRHHTGLYKVTQIVTHRKIEAVWTKLQDPDVIYEHLEAQYDYVNGGENKVMVIKCYSEPLSNFLLDFTAL